MAQLKPIQTAILRRNLTKDQIKAEEKYSHEKLKATPETVSTTSSIHPMFEEVGTKTPEKDVDMMAGMRHDIVS